VYHSAKTAGSRVTQHFCAEFKGLNVSNAIGHTNQNTTENLDGATRLTPRLTCQDWKPKKRNQKKGIMPSLVQVSELSWRPSSRLQPMPILALQVQ